MSSTPPESIESLLTDLEQLQDQAEHNQKRQQKVREKIQDLIRDANASPGARKRARTRRRFNYHVGAHVYILNPLQDCMPHIPPYTSVPLADRAAVVETVTGSKHYIHTYSGFLTVATQEDLRRLIPVERIELEATHPDIADISDELRRISSKIPRDQQHHHLW